MKKSRAWATKALWLAVAGCLWGCSREEKSSGYFKTHFQDESQFIVEEVLTDVAGMAYYGANKQAPDGKHIVVHAQEAPDSIGDKPTYTVEIRLNGKTVKLEPVKVTEGIWSPAIYAGAVRDIFNALRIQGTDLPEEEAQDRTLLTALLDDRAETIAKLDRELASALADDFMKPELHERAAVLLGAFALRDSAGEFYDARLPMCRMTAHLAFAQGLTAGTPFGVNGRLANAQLLTLMNNEQDALASVEKLTQPEFAAWARVLRARNTHDYRELQKSGRLSRLEQIELFRARAVAIDTGTAWSGLTSVDTPSADYYRVVNANEYSVDLGHVVASDNYDMEMKEIQAVYQIYEGRTPDPNNLAGPYAVKPGRCVARDEQGRAKVEVIGWGQWSFFSQRHDCLAMTQNYSFASSSLGMPDRAAAYSKKIEPFTAGLFLGPAVRLYTSQDEAAYHKAVDELVRLEQESPHLVPPGVWNYLRFRPGFGQQYVPADLPKLDAWYRHDPPPGTVYDLRPRLLHPPLRQRPDVRQLLVELHAQSPYDTTVVRVSAAIRFFGERPAYEQVEPWYHAGLDFNLQFMTDVASLLTNRPAEFENLLVKAAQLSPCTYRILGVYFMERGDEDKGAGYLEKSLQLCKDAVANANQAGLLTHYYWKKGMKDQAYRVAEFAADRVYSELGLEAKAELLEMDERYGEAFDYYKKIQDRYQDNTIVANFLKRYHDKTGETGTEKLEQGRIKALFPQGLEQVTLSDFQAAPRDGVLIAGQSAELTKAGLQMNMVIVALNGLRVHSFEQYLYKRASLTGLEMDLIVWQGSKYTEVKASPPGHQFGVSFITYVPK